MVVTQENFKQVYEDCKAGKLFLFFPTYTRNTVVHGSTIKRFADKGIELIKLQGSGFSLARGRKREFYFAGGLIASSY